MNGKRNALKPQDVVVLFSLLLVRKSDWVVAEIASAACLSSSETHAAIKRLSLSGLFSSAARRPVLPAVQEFLIHALKYAFPAEIGGRRGRGMPTAHSAPPLAAKIAGEEEDVAVWPCPYGNARGVWVSPLYKSVPDAAQRDPDMYELLALADAVCIGRARERKLAGELLCRKVEEFAREAV